MSGTLTKEWLRKSKEVVGVRIFPPLTIPKEMMDSGLEILESTIKEVNEEYRKL